MLSNDRNEFNESLIKLFSLYGKQPDPEIYSYWFSLFQEYELPKIKEAFVSYSKTSNFPPVPAAVLNFINGRVYDVLAEEAWDFVPKLETESGYVTAKMMRALGVAEELLAVNDAIGARLSFIRTYNNLPADNKFYYSEAYGVDYEEKEQRKIDDYRKLECKGWMNKEQLAMIVPSRLILIENGSDATRIESNKKQVEKLRLITNAMPCLNQKDISAD